MALSVVQKESKHQTLYQALYLQRMLDKLSETLLTFEKIAYLAEGPDLDDYEVIDSVSIDATSETTFDFSTRGRVIWTMSLLNDGSNDLEIRFTMTAGRNKKVRIKPTDVQFDLDLKGAATQFKVIALTGSTTLRGIVWLKRPFVPSPFAGGIPALKPSVEQEPLPGYIG